MKRFLAILAWTASTSFAISLDGTPGLVANLPNSMLTGTISNFTVHSGATLLVLCMSGSPGPANSITSVTWNNSSSGWTRAYRQNTGGNIATEIWYLVSPPVGTASVTVTLPGYSGANGWGFVVYSLFGTAVAGPVYGATGDSAVSGSTSITTGTINVAQTGDWLIDVFNEGAMAMPTAATGQFLAASLGTGSNQGYSSYKSNVPAGGTTMGWTWTGGSGNGVQQAAIAIKSATAKIGGFAVTM